MDDSKSKSDDLAVFYKIIAGSFKLKGNAEERVSYLSSLGIDSFVQAITISTEIIYRVQAGAYSNRDLAEKHLDEVKEAGIKDAFIVSENVEDVDH